MTVSAQTPINRSTANGVTTVFPYDFKILAAADLEVSLDGVVKTLTTDYTLSGVGDDAGGNVTMLSAPANGVTVVRRRNMAYTREVDYQDQGELPTDTLDDDQDAPILMIQQVAEGLSRAVSLPPESTGVSLTLPTPAALQYLRWNAAADALESVLLADVSLISLTAYAQTLLNAVDAAAARVVLGITTFGSSLVTAANAAAARTAMGAAASGANNDITSLGALTVFNGVQKRQTVLAGAATRIAIGTGLAVNLLATTTPVRVSFAAGIGAQGTIDRVSTLSADVTGFWSGLTANVVNYLFYDRNTSTGAVTGVASVLPYIAQNSSAAISVVNGQHTYVYDTGQMYVGNGSVATAVDRTAEGECLAGAATITTVTSYAMQREYDSGYTATVPAAGTVISKNHNLGTNTKLDAKFLIECTTTDANWPVGYILAHYGLSGFNGSYAYVCTLGVTRLVALLTVPTNSFLFENAATGALANLTSASWKYKMVVNTPW